MAKRVYHQSVPLVTLLWLLEVVCIYVQIIVNALVSVSFPWDIFHFPILNDTINGNNVILLFLDFLITKVVYPSTYVH